MSHEKRILEVMSISSGYGKKQVLYDVSISVDAGEVVAVLGHNGAGKTTLLRSLIGLVPVYHGRIRFSGIELARFPYWERVAAGMTFTPAEAPVFSSLSIRDNLELGAFTVRDGIAKRIQLDLVFSVFPFLAKRQHQLAGTLSGGEQRMLALGIALMAKPKLMLLDEPSLGLSPNITQSLFKQIHRFAIDQGLAVVLVEQNVRAALRIADRAYFMRNGHIILEEDAEQALARGHWWDLF